MPPKKIPAKGVKGKKKAEAKAVEKAAKVAKVQAKRKALVLTSSSQSREESKEGEARQRPQCA